VDTQNRQLTDPAETLTRARNAGSVAGMSNVLDDDKQQEIRALGRVGWTLSRIQEATGVGRETISGYLKAAGIPVRGRGRPSESKPKPAISPEVSTDSRAAKPAISQEVSTDSGPPQPCSSARRFSATAASLHQRIWTFRKTAVQTATRDRIWTRSSGARSST
jgi:hypothetical protein